MKTRDYYRLAEVSETDLAFLAAMFRKSNPELWKGHSKLIIELGYIANANNLIQKSGTASEEEKKFARDWVIEAEEKLQGGIEKSALPIVEELRRKQLAFLSDYSKAVNFFEFLAQQYFRTRAVRDAIGAELRESIPGLSFEHLKNIVCHCGANNVGASLFVDREKFEVAFLESRPDSEFITGDQPIINLFRSKDENTPPTELALYYPLEPGLAMVLSPKEYELKSTRLSSELVDELNGLIVLQSREFLVAKSPKALRGTIENSHESGQKDGGVLLGRLRDGNAGRG